MSRDTDWEKVLEENRDKITQKMIYMHKMAIDIGLYAHRKEEEKMTQAEKIEEIIAKIEKLNELELEIRADMADIGIDYDSIGAEYQVYCSRSKLRDKGK